MATFTGTTGADVADAGTGTLTGFTGGTGGELQDGIGDSIDGGAGNDSVVGGSGNDTIDGGAGDDTLDGGLGNDTLLGGADNDLILSSAGVDSIDGGTGNDVLILDRSSASANLTLNLTSVGTQAMLAGDGTTVLNVDTFNIISGSGNDFFNLLSGNDTVDGGAGNDTIYGGTGSDSIVGGLGTDNLQGGDGNDTLSLGDAGDNNNQYAYGGIGDDSITAGAGYAQIYGDAGNDTINVSAALSNSGKSITIYGGTGNDIITGSDGVDTIYGDANDDSLVGGAGNDALNGGAGNDTLNAGAGDDTLTSSDNEGPDTIDGGADNDYLTISRASSALANTVDFSNASVLQTLGDGSTIVNVERIGFTSGSGADVITSSNYMTGATPNGANWNTVFGGGGNDSLTAASNGAYLSGDAGDDTLTGSAAADSLQGGADNDLISLGGNTTSAWDYAYGGAGNDTIGGATGWAYVYGDGGNDVIDVSGVGINTGKNTNVNGGTGNDIITGSDGVDTLNGDANDDSLVGGGGNDALNGGAGADTVLGGSGDDTLTSSDNEGPDTIDGGADNDYLTISRASSALANIVDFSNASVLQTLGDGSTIVNVERISFTSGSGSDVISSSNYATGATPNGSGWNYVYGGGGNDSLSAASNGAYLSGDAGDDTLTGSAAADSLQGGADNDLINLGGNTTSAWDYAYGGAGNDTIGGATGWAYVYGDGGNDVIDVSGAGINTGKYTFVYGGTENDSITGSAGADNLYGEAGDDTIAGGLGNDTLNGGDGNDLISDTGGANAIDGGNNTDRLILDRSSASANLTFAMANTTSTTTLVNDGTTVINVETIYLTGGSGNDTFTTFTGDDSLVGGAGNDSLNAGNGNDTLLGGAGNDTLQGGAGADSLDGGDDSDTYNFATGDVATGETIADSGTAGTDTIRLLSSTDFTSAGAITGFEALTFTGAGQTASFNASQFPAALAVTGVTGTETIEINMGSSTSLLLTQANFSVTGGTVVMNWIGDGDAENMASWDAADSMSGGGGNDIIQARGGDDTVDGGLGDDSISGGQGNDTMTGGAGDDSIKGGQQTDVVNFSGDRATYTIERVDVVVGADTYNWRVIDTDGVANGNDGTDLLQAVETLAFGTGSPATLSIASLIGALSDNNGVANTVAENASSGTTVGLTALAVDGNAEAVTYSLTNNAGGKFAIDSGTGVVTVAGALDYETATSHIITVRATSADGSFTEKTFTIAVTDVNEAPTGAPTATLAAGTEDVAYTVSSASLLQGFTDPEGNTLSVTNLTASNGSVVDNGDGTFTITPTANFNGTVTLTYDVSDGFGGSLTGQTRSYTLAAVNDAPTGSPTATLAGGTEDVAYTVSAADLLLGFSDAEGDTLSVANLTASNGSIVDNGDGTYSITPTGNFNGTVTLTYDVSDGFGGSLTNQTRSYTLAPVNDAPTAPGTSSVSTTEDTASSAVAIGATDIDGDTLSYSVKSGTEPGKGSVSFSGGNFIYTPSANANGSDSFTILIDDGHGGTAEQVVSVSITATNDAPTGSPTATLAGGTEDVAYTVSAANLLQGFSDADGDTLSVANLAASNGSVVNNGDGTYTITPTVNFNGTVTLTYGVSDGHGGSLTGQTRSYTLAPVNDAPTDIALSSATVQEFRATNTVVGNLSATDPDSGDTRTYTLIDSAGGRFKIVGSQLQVANGVLLDYEQSHSHQVSVRVTDAGGLTYTETLVITVTDVNPESVTGTAGNDKVVGGALADTMIGGLGNDSLSGAAGNDSLDGGGGNDTLVGGAGNDTYVVDAATDVITETAGSGTADRVKFSSTAAGVTYVLASTADVEFLETANAAATTTINLTGNALANTITGNAGANILDGGLGTDTLAGGAGNDTYIVNVAADVVTETSTGGTADRVKAAASYTLGSTSYVEFLETTNAAGTTVINLTGNGFANTITGNAGVNLLDGAAGNDTIIGGAGNDTLDGGLGNDSLSGGTGGDFFCFDDAFGATNVDSITDFVHGTDKVQLENAIFTKLSGTGALTAAQFFAGTAAHDLTDRIIYNATTGAVLYDADGNKAGGVAAIQIATLTSHPAGINQTDFIII